MTQSGISTRLLLDSAEPIAITLVHDSFHADFFLISQALLSADSFPISNESFLEACASTLHHNAAIAQSAPYLYTPALRIDPSATQPAARDKRALVGTARHGTKFHLEMGTGGRR